MQPDNKRPPEQDDSLESSDVDSTAFDPGDSFSNSPSDMSDAGELPSWLRNFAGSTNESDDANAASSTPDPGSSTASPIEDAAVAGIVRDTAPLAPRADALDPLSGDSDSNFFSEDDLPEWLRALSLDGQAPGDGASTSAIAADAMTAGGARSVPQVSRAWVTASEVPEVSAGANLLSSLVAVVDSRPEVVTVEAATPAPSSAKAVTPAKAAAPKAAVTATGNQAQTVSTPVAPAAPAASADGSWSRTRILLIVAIIIVLILLILFLS